jgi:hypothetical protein
VWVKTDEAIKVKNITKGGGEKGVIETSVFSTLIVGNTRRGDLIKFKQVNGKSSNRKDLSGKEIKPDDKRNVEDLINLSKTIGIGIILRENLPDAYIAMQGKANIGVDKYPGIVDVARKSGIIFPSQARFK